MRKIAADRNYILFKKASGGIKVVYNNTYGGFSTSREAQALYERLSGRDYPGDYDVDRHDPVLVEVVEAIGSRANDGSVAELKIWEIEGNQYRITEYDGLEGVQTPENIQWITADIAKEPSRVRDDFDLEDDYDLYQEWRYDIQPEEDELAQQEGMGRRMPTKHTKRF